MTLTIAGTIGQDVGIAVRRERGFQMPNEKERRDAFLTGLQDKMEVSIIDVLPKNLLNRIQDQAARRADSAHRDDMDRMAGPSPCDAVSSSRE